MLIEEIMSAYLHGISKAASHHLRRKNSSAQDIGNDAASPCSEVHDIQSK